MQKINIALKKQKREIETLKQTNINTYSGLGKAVLLCFNDHGVRFADGSTEIQKKINEGYYESIKDFDGFHSADVEFSDLYHGRQIEKYRSRTKQNLIELGKVWRQRVLKDFPGFDIVIVVYQQDGNWFLDTFNWPVEIKDGIYL